MRVEAKTAEETFEAFELVMDSGSFPTATKFSDKLVVAASRVAIRDCAEDFGSKREWVVDYMTSSDDAMEFLEGRGIDIEGELL